MESLSIKKRSKISLGLCLALGLVAGSQADTNSMSWSSQSAFVSSDFNGGFIHVSVSHDTQSGGAPFPPITVEPMPGEEPAMSHPFMPMPPMDEVRLMIHHMDMEKGWEGSYFGSIDKNAFNFNKDSASLDVSVCISYREFPMPDPHFPPIPEPIMDGEAPTTDSAATMGIDEGIIDEPKPGDPGMPPHMPPPMPPIVGELCGDITLNWKADNNNYHRDRSSGENKHDMYLTKHKSRSSGGSATVEGVILDMPVMNDPMSHSFVHAGLNQYSSKEKTIILSGEPDEDHHHDH